MTEPNEDYRHEHQDVRVENGVQFGDLEQFLDYHYIANVAKVNASALAALADGPAAPKAVKVEASTLSVDTQLEWQPNTEPDLAGYEILSRHQRAVLVARDSGRQRDELHRQGITKDNFLFGVRAVDNDGNRSSVTLPSAEIGGFGVGVPSADAHFLPRARSTRRTGESWSKTKGPRLRAFQRWS